MNRVLPHVRTNAYLNDRLVSAGSCDKMPRTLEITKQVDDYFGAVLNSKKSSWSSAKPRRVVAGKLCELIDYTRSLVYLRVDVLMRGAPMVRASCANETESPGGWCAIGFDQSSPTLTAWYPCC